MWGIIARKRVKKDGRKPKQLWHDLLTEFTNQFENKPFFGGDTPNRRLSRIWLCSLDFTISSILSD